MKQGWTYKQLKDVTNKISDGSHNPPKGIAYSEYPMLSSKNILFDDFNYDSPRYLSKEDFDIENKRTYISDGDVLLTIVGTVGRTCCVQNPFIPFTLQRSVAVLKPKKEILISRFLMYALYSLSDLWENEAKGAAQKGVYLKQLATVSIPTPPISEQERIVERLDAAFAQIDELKSNAERQLAEARALFQSALTQDMQPKPGWQEKTLGEIATDMYRGSGIRRDQITKEGIPCVRYGEIYTTYNISFEDCVSHTLESSIASPKYFEHGDLLFAITGESVEDIGKTIAYMGKKKCLLGGDIICMKHNQNPKFLSYALSTTDAIKQKGFGKTKLKVVHTNAPSLKAIRIPLPPLSEQQGIVEQLDSFSTNISSLEEINQKIKPECDALKQALLRQIFE